MNPTTSESSSLSLTPCTFTSELLPLRDFSLLRFAGGSLDEGDDGSELGLEDESCLDSLREILASDEFGLLSSLHHCGTLYVDIDWEKNAVW